MCDTEYAIPNRKRWKTIVATILSFSILIIKINIQNQMFNTKEKDSSFDLDGGNEIIMNEERFRSIQ